MQVRRLTKQARRAKGRRRHSTKERAAKADVVTAREVSPGLEGSGHRFAIIYRKVGELKPDPRNPRVHSAHQIRLLAKSMAQAGCVSPVVVDGASCIKAGHARLLAAVAAGHSEVPTVSIEHLSPNKTKAFVIADNRLAELAKWDDRLLAEHLRDLSAIELDFDLDVTGFAQGEIDLRIEGMTSPPAEPDPADELPPQQTGPAVSRLNDLWQLGRNRLLCNSCLDDRSYVTVMDGRRASMIFSDPPYNVPIVGHASGLGAVRHREFAMASGEMDSEQFTKFLTQSCQLQARYSQDGSLHFICMDWRHIAELLAAGRIAYSEFINLCVWVKSNGGMGSMYRSRHELVFLFRRGKARHRNNVELGRFGRNRTNVWEYPNVSSFGRSGDEGNLLAMHPTVKPVRMIADAILDCTARGDIILDSFLGSGSTLMAADRVGRRCFGIEIDPLYCDTAIRRWQTYTGDIAHLVSTGQSFAELEGARGGRHAK